MNNLSKTSTLLTCLGVIGVIATAVMAAKATPRAIDSIDDATDEKGEELTKFETFKAAAPAYIPTVMMGAATIACVFGSNALNKQSQASIISAYALLDNSYKEYKRKVEELYGEEADHNIKEAIAKEKYDEIEMARSEDKQLFLDFNTLRYFEAPMDDVLQKVTTDDGMECWIVTTPFDSYSDAPF